MNGSKEGRRFLYGRHQKCIADLVIAVTIIKLVKLKAITHFGGDLNVLHVL